MKQTLILLTWILIFAASALAQLEPVRSVREYRTANEHQLLSDFVEMLAIPNVASDTPNILRNADYLIGLMKKSGLNPRLLELADKSVPPAVYGEWQTPGATHTLIIYAHYDGQPTDPKQWTGIEPWVPTLMSAPMEKSGAKVPFPKLGDRIDPEWRLYADRKSVV